MANNDNTKYFFKNTSQNNTKNILHIKKTGYANPAKASGQNFAGEIYKERYEHRSIATKKILINNKKFVATDTLALFFLTGFFFVFNTLQQAFFCLEGNQSFLLLLNKISFSSADRLE